MEHQNIGSALILSCAVDVEMDLKPRLAAALGGGVAKEYDILFVGRTDSEPVEPMVDELKQALYQLNRTAHLSEDATQAKLERYWIKKEFLQRRTLSYRSTFPRGTHAYALSGRMARRMARRLAQRMANEAHDLDFILADIAMVGLSIAYSIAPPPIAIYDPESNNNSKQFLRESVLSAISIRADQPSTYPPYDDVAEIWPY
ncbi:hypothetical protein H4S06_000588 [Coemansia sp. BCRC 34490]|nr:hypothetical protein H4S06_000588 [Coemansia sp. BCRC 34490]